MVVAGALRHLARGRVSSVRKPEADEAPGELTVAEHPARPPLAQQAGHDAGGRVEPGDRVAHRWT